MTATLEEFQQAFKTEALEVYTNDSWTWSVRPQQPTLGASVLSMKRFAARLSEMTEKEARDLRDAVTVMEGALQKTFGFEKFNYLMLMMVDDHVHYHCIPRYSGEKTHDGQAFPDTGWPKFPDLAADVTGGDDAALASIVGELRKNL
ncbi:MAG: hypothetical protein ABJ007_10150 [Pseudophaeobacter sp.]|uniref:HIT family protein n=1 Tax=Pseudophaeobacter sp. TaxID=1971739 RepID=UPI003297CDAD